MQKKIVKKTAVKKHTITAKKPVIQAKKEENKAVTIGKIGLHNLKSPFGSHKRKRILGRGSSSGHGKTSTRGSKGQTSRSGRVVYAGFEGGQTPLIRRIPKRGFTSKFKQEYQIVNLENLNKIKESIITLELLEKRGLIKNKERLVKILGDGEIKAPVTVQAHAFSKTAGEKIKTAGGKVEIINA